MPSPTTERRFTVVRNDEEQYSIWPADRALPSGWYDQGVTGSKESCLAFIGREWTDLRPRTLREMAGN
ncbi:MbtH family NRPS accessory protein [Streptomyces sp. NBC_00435]|uniref:MbtH family protein n=1 Tax=Streptomyces sp. NBC_00435 TaxID=2903649 RepID=UPI002E2457F7